MGSNRSIDTLTIMFGQGLNTLINLIFVPFLSRSLSLTENGTYGQAIIVIDFISMFFQFGLYKVLYKFYADIEVENSSAFRNNLLASLVLGGMGILFLLAFAPFIAQSFNNPALKPLLVLYSVVIPFNFLSQTFVSSLVFYKKIKASVVVNVLSNVVKILGVLFAIQVLHSLEFVFYALIFAAVLQTVLSYAAIPRLLKAGRFDWKLIKSQLELGLPLGITAILGVGFRYTDGAMISTLMTTNDFAIYRNGAFELPFIGALYVAIGTVLLPDMAKFYSTAQYSEIVRLKKRSISITCSIILPVVIFILFFNKPIIVAYLSEKYAASSTVFMIYSLVLLIRITDYQALFIITGNNKTQLYIYTAVFGVNLLLNLVFIQVFGLIGPAISAVLSTFLLAYLLLFYSTRYIQSTVSALFDTKVIAQIAAISGIIAAIFWLPWNYFTEINPFWVFPLFGFYLVVCLHFFLKTNSLDIGILLNILNKSKILAPVSVFLQRRYLQINRLN